LNAASRMHARAPPPVFRCGGVCCHTPGGGCVIKLSEPLLKLRPPEDLKNTLLHEMVHAYIFLKRIPGAGPDGHGPPFKEIMHRINQSTQPDLHRPTEGYKLTVYHSMHDEVKHYQTHWWECERCDP
jgi:predicted SprT family Zn-dependent metalloprotease